MTRKSRPIEERFEDACSPQPSQEQLDAIGEGVQSLGFWGNAGESPTGPMIVMTPDSDDVPWAHLPIKLGADGGRPSTYRPETFWKIMQELRIATPLTVAADNHGTSDDRVMDWVKLDQSGTLSREVTRARDRGWDKLAMDVLEIADEYSNDYVETKDGPRLNNEAIQRSKLRIWARLELLKKWDPRRYGEMLKLTGDRDNPVSLESRTTMSDEQLAQIASKALK